METAIAVAEFGLGATAAEFAAVLFHLSPREAASGTERVGPDGWVSVSVYYSITLAPSAARVAKIGQRRP